ncbi:MAG TPA: hypothetical protein VFV61_01080 [Pyrinomonadaceae bacterium]|nr:hypothetical protein [Pyrinomonadaceae bacterium]
MIRWKLVVTCAGVLLFAGACGGSLYKVKPVVELSPLTNEAKRGSAGGLDFAVAPLLSDEESQDLFEANLPLAGVLPLRIELGYESGVPVEIKKTRFHLRDGAGKEWKLVSPKQAISRILKANEVYAYNPNSRKQFEKEFGAYGLDLKTPLTAGERRRQGFLFFQTPDKEAVSSPRGLVLVIEGLTEPLSISIN